MHDPQTGQTSQVGTGFGWSVVDDAGDVYISAGGDLFRYNVPGSDDAPEEQVEVRPEAVVFIDEPGSQNGAFTIPDVEGVQYLRDGEVLEPGTYPASGSITITAEALEGYVLADGAETEWTHTFDAEPAQEPSEPGESPDQEDTGQESGNTADSSSSEPEGDLPGTGFGLSGFALVALAFLALGVLVLVRARRVRITS